MALPTAIRVAEEVQEPYHSAEASDSFSGVQSDTYKNDKVISLRKGAVKFIRNSFLLSPSCLHLIVWQSKPGNVF